ncbi:hypothetical protein [Psychrobacter sp. AOP31-A1-22]|uniref:hypothetical protein n=1 Tax=Psychrobacter sp. AOP31-A1-22 TaxID=3457696 RepID=UPI0040367960
MSDTNTTLKNYDVTFTISVSGYEKEGLCRVAAVDEHEAIYEAVVAEIHNLDDDEVRKWFESDEAFIEDDDMVYREFGVVELFPVEVVIDGEVMTALLPKNNDKWLAGGRYFQ